MSVVRWVPPLASCRARRAGSCRTAGRVVPARAGCVARAEAAGGGTWTEAQDEAVLDTWAVGESEEASEVVASSLEKLEWRALCEQVGRFCATHLGREAVCRGRLGATRVESEALLAETAAALSLEQQYATALHFGGADTRLVKAALQKARLGAALSGAELLGVAALQGCAEQLQRTVAAAGCAVDARGRTPAPQGAAPEVQPLRSLLSPLVFHPAFGARVRQCVEEDGRVKDSASPELAAARSRRGTAESRARRQCAALGLQVVSHLDRLCCSQPLAAPLPDAALLLGPSADGREVLLEPMAAVAANNELEAAMQAERQAELALRLALTLLLCQLVQDFEAQLVAVAALDAIAARARHASALRCCAPVLAARDTGARLLQLRHPLLVERVEGPPWEERRDGGAAARVTPVDVLVPAGSRVVLLSGPNTGGKTASAKALALAALSARAGLFVCAESARLPWFDRVLVDCGDEQSLSAGLSTFSGRLQRSAALLRCATPRSLLLLDELGAGTAPGEGAALGTALLQACARAAQLTLATSHSGQLKALKYGPHAQQAALFENAACEFDAARLLPTYRLLWGVPGRSRALDIAQRLGLDAAVVQEARKRLGEQDSAGVEELVASLEESRVRELSDAQLARQAVSRAELHQGEITAALRRLDARGAAREQRRAEAVGRAALQAQQQLARRRAAAKAPQQSQKPEPPAKPAPPPAKLAEAPLAVPSAPWVPRVGDTVLLSKLGGAPGVVAAIDGLLTVRAGSLQLRVRAEDVSRGPPGSAQPRAKAAPKGSPRARAALLMGKPQKK